MGCADLVPGVSGGTIALILGIYERLIASLSGLSRRATWTALLRGRPVAAWRAVDGGFLVVLAAGIVTALATLPVLLEWLVENRRAGLYAVFFGLIAASALLVFGQVRRRRPRTWAWAVGGAVGAFVLVGLTPARTPETVPFLVASGAVAVSALLLPGVSGAFILVVLGKYDTILAALASRDLAVLAPFTVGLGLGLLAFSRVLSYALARWHDAVMALLAGVLVGSLRKVWPWQETVGAASLNQAPPGPAAAVTAAALALAAAAAVWLLERRGRHGTGA